MRRARRVEATPRRPGAPVSRPGPRRGRAAVIGSAR